MRVILEMIGLAYLGKAYALKKALSQFAVELNVRCEMP